MKDLIGMISGFGALAVLSLVPIACDKLRDKKKEKEDEKNGIHHLTKYCTWTEIKEDSTSSKEF